MKQNIVSYFQKTKKIIIALITSISLLALTYLVMFVFFINKQEVILAFSQSKKITKEILPFTLMTLFSKFLFITIVGLVILLIIKALFPNTKAFSSLMMKDEAEFLLSLPSRFREGREEN